MSFKNSKQPAPQYNSSLANVLKQLNVSCSPCALTAIQRAATPQVRQQYYKALRMTPEQEAQVEQCLK
jgi:spore coat protein CotF